MTCTKLSSSNSVEGQGWAHQCPQPKVRPDRAMHCTDKAYSTSACVEWVAMKLEKIIKVQRNIMQRMNPLVESSRVVTRQCLEGRCSVWDLVAPTGGPWSTQPFQTSGGAWVPPGVLSSWVSENQAAFILGIFFSFSPPLLAEVLSIKITVRKGRNHILAFLSESLPDI